MSTAPSDPHEVDGLDFPTSLGTSTADRIGLLGQDLTADLMGKVRLSGIHCSCSRTKRIPDRPV